MPSFVSNSSHFFQIDASSPRPCTNNTGDDGFPSEVLDSDGRLVDEPKIAAPIATATTATAITITNFLLTNFLCAGSMRHHLLLWLYALILIAKFIRFYAVCCNLFYSFKMHCIFHVEKGN